MVKRMEKDLQGRTRYPVEAFVGLKPAQLFIIVLSLRSYGDLQGTYGARIAQITNNEALHNALGNLHKNVEERSRISHTRAQKRHNARTNVLPPEHHGR